ARHVRASVVPLDLAADGRPKISAAADDGAIHLLLPRSGAFRVALWNDELAPAERTAMAAALGGTIVLHPGATVRGSVRNGKADRGRDRARGEWRERDGRRERRRPPRAPRRRRRDRRRRHGRRLPRLASAPPLRREGADRPPDTRRGRARHRRRARYPRP